MFVLKNKSGETAVMRNGNPFLYSSRETARMGVKHLAGTKGDLTIALFVSQTTK